jgi:hypothetical protein
MAIENAPIDKIEESLVLETPELSPNTSADDEEQGSGDSMEAEASGKMEELLLEVNNEAEAALD